MTKWVKYLQFGLFTAVILYFGKTLFIPFFMGLLIAMVMYPVCKWLEKKGWNRSLAIMVCLLIVAVLLSALLALLVWQLKVFSQDAPLLLSRLEVILASVQ